MTTAQVVKSKVHGSEISKLAINVAAALDAIPDFIETIKGGAVANEEDAKTAFKVLIVLREDYGADKMDTWPMPGTKAEDVGENEPYDKYNFKDAAQNVHRGSFIADVAKNCSFGKEHKQVLDEIAAATRKENPENNRFRQMVPSAIDPIKKRHAGKLKYVARRLREAVTCHHKINMASKLPGIKVSFAMDIAHDPKTGQPLKGEDGKPVKVYSDTTMPIRVADTTEDRAEFVRYFTVPEFNRLSTTKAIEKGGNMWEAFTNSNTREPHSNAKATVPDVTLDVLASYCDKIAKWFGNPENEAAFLKYLKTEKGKHLLASWGTMMNELDSPWSKTEEAYDKYMEVEEAKQAA